MRALNTLEASSVGAGESPLNVLSPSVMAILLPAAAPSLFQTTGYYGGLLAASLLELNAAGSLMAAGVGGALAGPVTALVGIGILCLTH